MTSGQLVREPTSGGVYISIDPIGLGGGINTFSYAQENPIIYIEESAESPVAIAGAIIGCSVSAVGGYFSAKAYIDAQSANSKSKDHNERGCRSDSNSTSVDQVTDIGADLTDCAEKVKNGASSFGG